MNLKTNQISRATTHLFGAFENVQLVALTSLT